MQDLQRRRVETVIRERHGLPLEAFVAGHGHQPAFNAAAQQKIMQGQGGIADRVTEMQGRQELFNCHGSF